MRSLGAAMVTGRRPSGRAPRDVLEGGPLALPPRKPDPLGYAPGAGGALTGPESALSSLPSCPCNIDARRGGQDREADDSLRCGAPSHRFDDRDMRCSRGHIFTPTPEEREQARGALAAAERRAPHTMAERARALAARGLL